MLDTHRSRSQKDIKDITKSLNSFLGLGLGLGAGAGAGAGVLSWAIWGLKSIPYRLLSPPLGPQPIIK